MKFIVLLKEIPTLIDNYSNKKQKTKKMRSSMVKVKIKLDSNQESY